MELLQRFKAWLLKRTTVLTRTESLIPAGKLGLFSALVTPYAIFLCPYLSQKRPSLLYVAGRCLILASV